MSAFDCAFGICDPSFSRGIGHFSIICDARKDESGRSVSLALHLPPLFHVRDGAPLAGTARPVPVDAGPHIGRLAARPTELRWQTSAMLPMAPGCTVPALTCPNSRCVVPRPARCRRRHSCNVGVQPATSWVITRVWSIALVCSCRARLTKRAGLMGTTSYAENWITRPTGVCGDPSCYPPLQQGGLPAAVDAPASPDRC